MYSRGWTRECSESLQRRPALYVQDASSMGESRSLGRPEKAERRVAPEEAAEVLSGDPERPFSRGRAYSSEHIAL